MAIKTRLSFGASVGFLLLVACGKPESVNTGTDIQGVVTGRFVPEKELAGILKKAGFSADEIPTMVCIAKWESSLHAGSYNVNRDGSLDAGMFQINDIHWGDCGVSETELYDPAVNAKCARHVFNLQGYTAWYGYRDHQSECDNYRMSGI